MTPRVLVVEDEPVVRELLCQILHINGCESIGVETGEEALRVVDENRPEAMVLDLMLPDLDGFEVCRRVKERPAERIGVLVLTAMQASEARERAFQSGADRFLTKPFVPQDVIREVQSVAREYHESAEPGLRLEVCLDLSDGAEPAEALKGFLDDLFRTTPLTVEAIADIGATLQRIAQRVKTARNESLGINLACQVFRDRLQHTLRVKPERADRKLNGRDLFCSLFGASGDEPTPAFATQSGHSIRLAEDRPEILLTRPFS